MSEPAIFLTRAEIAGLMAPGDYLDAVEAAFRASWVAPPPMHLHAIGGAFHAKGAVLLGARNLVALKLNGNFPGNPARGLPTIQGVIVLCDATNGAVLAIMDSIEITLRRTAAATALAARHLARREAGTIAMCGCGDQARAQVEALAPLFPFRRGFAWDKDWAKAERFSRDMSAALGFVFEPVEGLRDATAEADIIVTCTTSREPFLGEGDVSPGAFVAAVGADNPEKSEIAPALMARAKVVVDVMEQCVAMGDLHQAIEAGAMKAGDVHADLGEIVRRRRSGRERADEIIVFDSTGTAIQDVASAAMAYERAEARGVGARMMLA